MTEVFMQIDMLTNFFEFINYFADMLFRIVRFMLNCVLFFFLNKVHYLLLRM